MKLELATIIAAALAVGAAAPAAEAQQHKATVLGSPATRFAKKPPQKADDVRVLLRGEKTKGDVAAVLNEVGWKGNLEDLDRAAASADITSVQIPKGTRLPFMASRAKGKPHALVDVLWDGRKPIDAFAFEMSSNCVRYRVVTPAACGNFWVEELGKDETSPQCIPRKPPVVSVSAAPAEVCVTQPAEIAVAVENPPDDGKVTVFLDGKELQAGTLSGGVYRATFPGAAQPGDHQVTAASGGVTSRPANLRVKACEPTCGLTLSPSPAKAGKPITVDLSGSRVATGVRGGIKSAKVEVVDPKGAVVGTYDVGSSNLSGQAVVIKKGGKHTVRAVVTDEAAQASKNTCEQTVDVQNPFPLLLGAYFGKERMTHDDDDVPTFSRCSPEVGFEIGVQPKIGDNTELEAAVGLKIPFKDDAHTAAFGDLAVNRVLRKGFVGAGLSYFDIGKDSGGVGVLLQGGVDLDKDGKWQFAVQARAPFSKFDDIDNNYQFWGGFRIRPFSSK